MNKFFEKDYAGYSWFIVSLLSILLLAEIVCVILY